MVEEKKESRKHAGCCSCFCGSRWFLIWGTVVVLAVISIYLLRVLARPLVIESFESGENGWLVVGDAQGESDKPTYQTSGGNPGAFMEAVDDAVGGIWYWAAPESFRLKISDEWEKRGGAGCELFFDLKQSDTSAPFKADDVILSDGKIELSYRHESPPGEEWTSYRIPLDAMAGWVNKIGNERAASRAEMDQVLRHLSKLWIRGEFREGPDRGGLDNVGIR